MNICGNENNNMPDEMVQRVERAVLNRKKEYCPVCDGLVVPRVGQREETREYHGIAIKIQAYYAYCPLCKGAEFITDYTHTPNLYYLQDEFLKRNLQA